MSKVVPHNPGQFVSPVNLPKEVKVNEFDRLFDNPIVQVDMTTGKDTGCGLEAAWERGRHRVQDKPLPKAPAPVKAAPAPTVRVYNAYNPADVLQAWEDSGHNKAKAARLMRATETTYRFWLRKLLPEVFDGTRRRK